jgi:pilus assembly protein CpaF
MTYEEFENVDLGPLEELLADSDIAEIMINGLAGVFIEKKGRLTKTDVEFESEAELRAIIDNILAAVGAKIDEDTPIVDSRLPDGSRVNAVLRPIAFTGPALTIMKMAPSPLTWEQILGYGSINQKMLDFLKATVRARRNMVIAGGPMSGKTTVINALSEFIPADERIITVENRSELRLRHPHVVGMETRPADADGKGAVSLKDLIINAQRMRPDRIISGELNEGGIWDMLQAMSLGYQGSMLSMHGTSVLDVLERLEMMATLDTNLPLLYVRRKITQAVDLVSQQMQLDDGLRRIVTVAEVGNLENNVIQTHDIFRFEVTGEEDGRLLGEFRTTGYVPTFAHLLDLPAGFFEA